MYNNELCAIILVTSQNEVTSLVKKKITMSLIKKKFNRSFLFIIIIISLNPA